MRSIALLPVLLCAMAGHGVAAVADPATATPAAGPVRAADQALRYVNDEVITIGDILARTQERLGVLQSRNQPRPQSPAETLRFMQETLEELTDESLLVQKAKELRFSLNRDDIALEVLERARDSGTTPTLKEQAYYRKVIERQRTIDAMIGFFDLRTAQISPERLHGEYQRRASEFSRPPSLHALQIVLRPTPAETRAQLGRERAELLKRAQAAADAQVKALAQERLAAYVADGVSPAEQDAILVRFAGDLAAQDGRSDLDVESLTLAKEARAVLARAADLRDEAATTSQLEAMRSALIALPANDREAAFRALAIEHSQGPNADRGGDLDWIEPGVYTAAFDTAVFDLPVNDLSMVFWSKEAASLVLVIGRKETRLRPFDEVVGEIENRLRLDRRAAIRAQTVAMLRAKASIRDLIPLGDLQK